MKPGDSSSAQVVQGGANWKPLMPRAQAGERLVPGFTRHTRSSPFARSNLPRPTHVRAAPKSLLNPAGAPPQSWPFDIPLLVCTVTTERREKHMHTSSVRLPPDLPTAASRSRSRGPARSQAVKATTIVSSAWRLHYWRGASLAAASGTEGLALEARGATATRPAAPIVSRRSASARVAWARSRFSRCST